MNQSLQTTPGFAGTGALGYELASRGARSVTLVEANVQALQASSNPHEFLLRLKGIQASSDTTWDRFEQNAPPPQPVGKGART